MDAAPSPVIDAYSKFGTLGILNAVLRRTRKQEGGLWVGGVVSVSVDRLMFEPNQVNRMAHKDSLSFEIRFADVTEVNWRRGFITNIIGIEHNGRTSSLRCFGSKAFAQSIRDAVAGPSTPSGFVESADEPTKG